MLYVQDKFPDAPRYLQERLAKATGRRRQLLKYYEQHHVKIKGKTEPACGESKSEANRAARHDAAVISDLPGEVEPVGGIRSPVLSRPSSDHPTVSIALNSHTTLSTYVDRTHGVNHDQLGTTEAESEAGQTQTSFAPSSTGGLLRIPQSPIVPSGTPFECPYCYLIITPKTTSSWMYVHSVFHYQSTSLLQC